MRMTNGYRSKPPIVHALRTPALLALLLAGCFSGCSRTNPAERDMDVGLRLMNSSFELTDELRESLVEELGLPTEIRERDAIIRFFMVRSAEAGEEYRGAYYFLGLHLLAIDCEQGKAYIGKYLDHREDEDAQEVLRTATEQGCEAAVEVARKQWSGSDG